MSCSGGSVYQGCGTRCPSTCVSSSASNTCSSLPVEGCFCKDGYVLSGDTCVLESNCGCVDDENRYHEASYHRQYLKKNKNKKEQIISISIIVRKDTIAIYTVNNSKKDSLCQPS